MNINELQGKIRIEVTKEDLKEFALAILAGVQSEKKTEEQVPQILTMDEAVKFTHHAKPTLYALTSKRLIPHFKRGKRLFFKKSELTEWMLAQKQTSVDEMTQQFYNRKKGTK